MAIGGYYLAVQVANVCAPMIRAYGSFVRDHFLPVFGDLNRKAEELADKAYEELMGQPATEEMDDPSEAAEAATSRGQDFYDTMFAMRQGSLNMFTAGLFHLVEQQLASVGADATFEAMGVAPPNTKLADVAKWYLTQLRLDLKALPSWGRVNGELRLIANAVKHGEGDSAEELRLVRPELFTDPRLAEFGLGGTHAWSAARRRLSTPLAGDDLFVTPAVFEEHVESVLSFLYQIRDHFLLHQDDQYPNGCNREHR